MSILGALPAIGTGLSALGGIFGSNSSVPDVPAFTAERVMTSTEAKDVLEAAGLSANYNAGEGADQALNLSKKFNDRITADLMNVIGEQMGGFGMRSLANQATTDQLKGRLSPATRRLLSSRAANSGAAALGGYATGDYNTALLGMATEQQVNTGVQNFGNLYNMYSKTVQPFRPEQGLAYTGLTPGATISGAISGAQLQYGYDQTQYNAQIGQATAEAGRNAEFWGGIGGLTSIAGSIATGGVLGGMPGLGQYARQGGFGSTIGDYSSGNYNKYS